MKSADRRAARGDGRPLSRVLARGGRGPLAAAMSRREALCCGAALMAAWQGLMLPLQAQAAESSGASAAADDPVARWRNPCRRPLPDDLTRHDAVLAAFEGLRPERVRDVHSHLLGTGDSGSGCRVHPSTTQWWRPVEVLRRAAILDAACVPSQPVEDIDARYVAHLHGLTQDFPAGMRWWLFAFDDAVDDEGRPRPDWSTFHVPDAYARSVAQAPANTGRFEWVASVHPYREDALARLQQALATGARAVKWLPSAMNIDPASPRCRPFYDVLARAKVPLIIHCGEERAAPGARREALVNPLLVRVPLSHGVPVIVAHAASLGEADDTDRRSAPSRPAFELFARVMDEHRDHVDPATGAPLLMADLSAVFQRNRRPEVWQAVLARQDWHDRLLNGSDYPLPGLMPLFAPEQIAQAGLLPAGLVPVLHRLRAYNPLLFDFVLKRSLRRGEIRLPAAVFEAEALSRRTRASASPRPASSSTS